MFITVSAHPEDIYLMVYDMFGCRLRSANPFDNCLGIRVHSKTSIGWPASKLASMVDVKLDVRTNCLYADCSRSMGCIIRWLSCKLVWPTLGLALCRN